MYSTFKVEYWDENDSNEFQGQVPQVTGQYAEAQIVPTQRGQRAAGFTATHGQPLPSTVNVESAHPTLGLDVGTGLGTGDGAGDGIDVGALVMPPSVTVNVKRTSQ